MRGLKIATVALCAAVWIGLPAGAQSLRAVSGPSELPPPGFKADQYVDSRGCVFIRAGYGGTTAWVPRVGNNRKPLCGQRASVSAQVAAPTPTAAAPAPVVAAVAPVRPVVKPAEVAPTVAAQAAPAVRTPPAVVAAAQPRARVVVPAASYVPARVATVAPQTPTPSGRMKVQIVANPAKCPGPISGTGERMLSDGRRVVSCGVAHNGTPVYLLAASRTVSASSAARPAPVVVRAAPVAVRAAPVVSATTTPTTTASAQCSGLKQINQLYLVDDGRLVVKCGKGSTYLVVGRADPGLAAPRATAARAAATAAATPIPKGYKLAWNDGRLSTTRGSQTAAGDGAMRLVWSDDTPRRLIDHTSGRDVTMDFAYLQFPYTSVAEQQQGTARLSAMNAPAPAVAEAVRFVQAGSFGVAANASVAAARLKAAGLPVRVSAITRNGKPLQIVLAGPFDRADQLAAALATTRASGFADAFVRD